MKTSVKTIAMFVVVLGISAMELTNTASAGQGTRGGSGSQNGGHRVSHRINLYGNGLPNPDNDSNGAESGIGTYFPAPTTFGPGSPIHGGGGNPNPVKHHPLPVQVPPASLPSGSATPK